MLLTLSLSVLIGLLLGLLGGGGSILTVPMLVYLLHVEPKTAITTSFVVVGLSSLTALIPHARRQAVCWKSGALFGLSGMAGAFGGGRLAGFFSEDLLMALFGAISLATGIVMARAKARTAHAGRGPTGFGVCPLRAPYLRLLFDGFFVGGLTGMIGVGGGFLIVPALALLVGLPMQGAVGTSLLVIAMNAAAGLAGYSQHAALDPGLILVVAAGALFGSAFGAMASGRVNERWLRRAFGLMVIGVGLYVLSQSLSGELLSDGQAWLERADGLGWLLLALLATAGLLRIGSWIHKIDRVAFAAPHSPDGP